MSHDRGCWKCGRDNWDYGSCTDKDCVKATPIRTDRDGERKVPKNMGKKKIQDGVKTSIDTVQWKYAEQEILNDMHNYLSKTYKEHYAADEEEETTIECFDAWIALGDSGPTFRNTALKYLWRYGKKNGKNLDDLKKAMHYIMMLMYVEHYKNKDK